MNNQAVTILLLSGKSFSGVLRYSVTQDTRNVSIDWNQRDGSSYITHTTTIPREKIKEIIYL